MRVRRRRKRGRAPPPPPSRVRSISAPRFVESGRVAAHTTLRLSVLGRLPHPHSLTHSVRPSVYLVVSSVEGVSEKGTLDSDTHTTRGKKRSGGGGGGATGVAGADHTHALCERGSERAGEGRKGEGGSGPAATESFLTRKEGSECPTTTMPARTEGCHATRKIVGACSQVALPVSVFVLFLFHSSAGLRGGRV